MPMETQTCFSDSILRMSTAVHLIPRRLYQFSTILVFCGIWKWNNTGIRDCLKKWRLGMDSVDKAGKSACSLVVNGQGKGVFSGYIDMVPPKDGKAKYAGYCAMRSKKLKKSFRRQDFLKMEHFTHLEMRVRGDGRTYNILLGLGMLFDIQWLDVYMYGLYTHGGPYWQTVQIPFSKFFLTSKGRIQDKQSPIPRQKIDSVGILCTSVPGPFRLEIDYIGAHRDENFREKFAYEMYRYPKWMVSN